MSVTSMRMRADANGDRSIGSLVGEATREVGALVRKEVELGKLEMKEEMTAATDTAKYFGVCALCAYLAVILLSFAAAWGLAEVMPAGVAFLIIGLVYG